MSRPAKRIKRDECEGHGCGQVECISCCPSGLDDITTCKQVVKESPSRYQTMVTRKPSVAPSFPPPPPPLPPPSQLPPPPIARPSYEYLISQLDDQTVRHMLASLAVTSPYAQAAITSAYEKKMRVFRESVIDFDSYSKDAWHVLNTSAYTRGRGSRQFEAAADAFSEVSACVEAIGQQTHPMSSYETKLSAVTTLRKIAKTVLLAGDTLGREIRVMFQDDDCLADTMLAIVQSMTSEEQRRAGATADEKGSLADKVRWVCDKAESYCINGFDMLNDVLALLLGEVVAIHENENEEGLGDEEYDEGREAYDTQLRT
ncbi:hypothetical protein F5Y19DRAFT_280159 [Xylariaceae sp. FL1651]|nr:hypothetical protein F5Y19DRAFT_280159 [Xylariaceae sp. FL1651]